MSKKSESAHKSEADQIRKDLPSWAIKKYLKDHKLKSLEQAIEEDCYTDVRSDIETLVPPKDEKADVLVPIGDLTNETIDSTADASYEDMTEDFIGTFNNAVTQGQKPLKVLFAFASAFAIVFGCSIRAGLQQAQAGKLLMMIGRNAAVSAKSVQILQNQDVGTAVRNVVKAAKRKVN